MLGVWMDPVTAQVMITLFERFMTIRLLSGMVDQPVSRHSATLCKQCLSSQDLSNRFHEFGGVRAVDDAMVIA
jgi:hypothetical protein